ncbi:MBL fold metallo-hydrolase [bacterium]|nr:MBL fold metallo-hydrolase [bacterium]
MTLIIKRKILNGVYLVNVPEADLKLLCGCPADAIKHLSAKGFLPIVEKDGIKFESGPNAILLSDTLIQNNALSNLSEFPVLHMFYNQGMILPGHPNNGATPILVGKKSFVQAQMKYIFIGNYGIVTKKEYLELGETESFTEEYLLMKQKFAMGRFIPSDELMKGIFLGNKPLEIKNGVLIKRKQTNVFIISYKDKSVEINLNLRKYQKYEPTYRLPKTDLPKHYFAVVHSGEGDGWDPSRPCLSSILLHDNRIFLVDAGPNILYTLKAFGLKPSQIDGVFFTHVHDDHFSGLYSLINTKTRVKVFATNTVKATIVQKLGTLLSVSEQELTHQFDFHELKREEWNDYQGLEIHPIPSAHPIDTTLFVFRVKDKNGYKSYGHYTDIAAIDWLKKMASKTPGKLGLSREYIEKIKRFFSIKVDVKKIDVGGPTVHGDAEDFAEDKSGRIVLGHTHAPFTNRQLEIGEKVNFGDVEILIADKPY